MAGTTEASLVPASCGVRVKLPVYCRSGPLISLSLSHLICKTHYMLTLQGEATERDK